MSAMLILLGVGLLIWMTAWFHRTTQPSSTSILLAKGLPSQTEAILLDSGRRGPTLFFVAGTHGNETAGFLAAQWLSQHLQPQTGRVLILPYANQQAIQRQQRTGPSGEDMNRLYPGSSTGTPLEQLTYEIVQLVLHYQPLCVVDLHEGFHFYGMEGSIGNSLVVGQTSSSFVHALDILEQVNEENQSLPPFALESNAPMGSLNHTASRQLGLDAFTVETTQKLPLETRVAQQLLFVENILSQYGVEYTLLNP